MKIQSVMRIFFLAYFFIYAISPLSRVLASTNAPELVSPDTANSSAHNLHIFLWEVIFTRLTDSSNAGTEQEDTGVRVLIRKARAILPEGSGRQGNSQDKTSIAESISPYPVQTPAGYYIADKSRKPANIISPLYSGNSPPYPDYLS